MNVLLLCDDYWHPGDVPINGVKLLEPSGFSFSTISDAADFSPSVLSSYPVTMLCKCNQKSQAEDIPWLTDDIQAAFVRYVEDGGGLLVVHSGTVPSETTKVMTKLMGCHFTFHPNNCLVTVAPLIAHPVTNDVGMFCEVDEHYRLNITDTGAAVIAASYSEAQGDEALYEKEPYHNTPSYLGAAGLVRTQGKGRVCVLTPGHTPEVWSNPEFQKLVKNALCWCAG